MGADRPAHSCSPQEHLARPSVGSRPILDGNKRTGLLAAIVFLDLNGVAIADPQGRLYDAMLGIAEHRLEKNDLAALLQSLAGPYSP